MKILHVTVHMGGGLGTVIMGWMDKVIAANDHEHRIVCLDYANPKAVFWTNNNGFPFHSNLGPYPRLWEHEIDDADIVLCHYYDHKMLAELFSRPLPACRLAFWVHKHYPISEKEIAYPDRCVGTSPIQFLPDYIWSTGDMSRFLEIKPRSHYGFNVGYVGTVDRKKIHTDFYHICKRIKEKIPEARFTVVGEVGDIPSYWQDGSIEFVGKVDDVAPYLSEFDIFGYPLRSNHFGTCEQVLGEAMCAGIPIVAMNNPAEKKCVAHGQVGLLALNSEGVNCYVQSVVYLYNHPGLREAMSAKARIIAKDKYSIDTMISQWNDTFEDMMEQSKKARGVL